MSVFESSRRPAGSAAPAQVLRAGIEARREDSKLERRKSQLGGAVDRRGNGCRRHHPQEPKNCPPLARSEKTADEDPHESLP
jgi:hypothetical protein